MHLFIIAGMNDNEECSLYNFIYVHPGLDAFSPDTFIRPVNSRIWGLTCCKWILLLILNSLKYLKIHSLVNSTEENDY